MIGVVELTAAVPAPDNRDHNTADRDSSSDRDASSAAIRKDQIKGRISSDRGIITGAANSTANDGYSHWMQNAYGWWLRFADNSYPKGKKHGTSGIAYAWELINGNWWAFDENGYAKTGWLRDETFGGWFYIDPERGMQMDGFGLVVPGIISTRYLMVERALCMPDGKHQTDIMQTKMARGWQRKINQPEYKMVRGAHEKS